MVDDSNGGPHVAVPDDDPQSELNVLRREVRQLQASVRDSAMQVASQQDELIELRKALTVAEGGVEEGLVRESNLRMQLELQSMKRQQVESTLSAAEALVSSLREMVMEGEDGHAEESEQSLHRDAGSYPENPYTSRKETGSLQKIQQSKLDRVLDSIDDTSDQETPCPQPREAARVDVSSVVKAQNEPVVPVESRTSDMEQDAGATTGDTRTPVQLVEEIPIRQMSAWDPLRTLSHPAVATSQTSLPKRHSLPRPPPAVTLPTPAPSQKPNLLMSAFRPSSTTASSQTSTIHSSRVQSDTPLPTEVVAVAKSEGVPARRTLPVSISFAASDAHSGDVYALASSTCGQWIASGGDDKTIKVYDQMGKTHASIAENSRAVTALGIHPQSGAQNLDSIIIYSGGSDGSIRAFQKSPRRRAKWHMSSVLPVHSQAVRRILVTGKSGINGSSNLILTCSTDRTIRLSDIEHSRNPFSVTSPSAVLDVASFGTAANGMIVSGHKDGGLRLWSSKDGNAMIWGTKIHSKGIISVCCLSDGQSVLTLGRDNALRLSDIRMNISVVREMEGGVQTVSDWHRAAVDGRFVACGLGRLGQLGVWNVDTGKRVRRVSTNSSDADVDVLDLMARKLRNPGSVVVPLWTASGQFVCAHRTRQISFWSCS